MQFNCPKCSERLEIDAIKLGKSARCPVCSLIFLVPKGVPSGEKKPGLSRIYYLPLGAAGVVLLFVVAWLCYHPSWNASGNPRTMTKEQRQFQIQLKLKTKLSDTVKLSDKTLEIYYSKALGFNTTGSGCFAEVEIATEDGQRDKFTVVQGNQELGNLLIASRTGTFPISRWNTWVTAGFDVNAVRGKGTIRFALLDRNQYSIKKDVAVCRISNWLEISFEF